MNQWFDFRPILTRLQPGERLALGLILLMGVWLRFQHLGAIESNLDQAYPVWQALNTLDSGHWPLIGQGTSVLFANPPLTGYIFLPFIALTRLHLSVYLVTLTFNTLAIWLTYRALRWLVGTRPALVGAFLFAVSPWIVEDSRRTWVQSMLPFWVTLIFWALMPVLTGQTRYPGRRLLIALVALSLFAHTYLLAYALIVPVGLLLLIFWRRIPKRVLMVGAGIFLVMMSLYGWGLYRDRATVEQRLDEFGQGERRLSSEAAEHSLRLITGWEFALVRGVNAPVTDWETRADVGEVINAVWGVFLALGIGHACYRLYRRDEYAPHALILLLWFGFPILLMSYVSQTVHVFYLHLGLPAGFALVAWGVLPLLKHRTGVFLISALLVVTGVVNSLNTLRLAEESLARPSEHFPTLNLADLTRMGQAIESSRPSHVVVYSPIDEWVVWASAGRDFPLVRTFSDAVQVIATDGSYYVQFETPTNPMPAPLHSQVAHEPVVLDDGTRLKFWLAAPLTDIPNAVRYPSDIEISFIGWEISGTPQPGQTVEVRTYWRIDNLLIERFGWTFSPYLHVFDNTSPDKLLILSGDVISPFTWRAGDVLIYRMQVSLPPDSQPPYRFVTGFFDSIRLVNAIFRVPQADGTTLFTTDLALGLEN
jgi:4-amino-4-deoxy-L-arabinose transferase-like glycosyltransferase